MIIQKCEDQRSAWAHNLCVETEWPDRHSAECIVQHVDLGNLVLEVEVVVFLVVVQL